MPAQACRGAAAPPSPSRTLLRRGLLRRSLHRIRRVQHGRRTVVGGYAVVVRWIFRGRTVMTGSGIVRAARKGHRSKDKQKGAIHRLSKIINAGAPRVYLQRAGRCSAAFFPRHVAMCAACPVSWSLNYYVRMAAIVEGGCHGHRIDRGFHRARRGPARADRPVDFRIADLPARTQR
jgi:hypothetical protein